MVLPGLCPERGVNHMDKIPPTFFDDLELTTQVHPDILKDYRRNTSVERILSLSQVEGGILTDQPTINVYAREREGGIGEAVGVTVQTPGGTPLGETPEDAAGWLYAERLSRLVGELINKRWVVEYADSTYVTTREGGVEVSIADTDS